MNNYVLLSDKKRDIDNALLLISIKSFKDSSSVFGMQFVLERQLAFPVILFFGLFASFFGIGDGFHMEKNSRSILT
jgi:hypothetical protein